MPPHKIYTFPFDLMVTYWASGIPWKQGLWGQHGVHLGPTGPRWAPCCPHESCYRGIWICHVNANGISAIIALSENNNHNMELSIRNSTIYAKTPRQESSWGWVRVHISQIIVFAKEIWFRSAIYWRYAVWKQVRILASVIGSQTH